jgi:hypothetical protein
MIPNYNLLTLEALARLEPVHTTPCLSLYQPTHRHPPGNRQDPILFGNLLKALESLLLQMYPDAQTRLLLTPFKALIKDNDFWRYPLDGLAVMGGQGLFQVFRLQKPVAELVAAADTFHTKPLRRFLQSVDRYQVLALSRNAMRLFEGNRDVLDEVVPARGVPRTIIELSGDEPDGPLRTVAPRGRGGKKNMMDTEEDRFFRAVDLAVLGYHSRVSGLPLMLAALPEDQHRFRKVSQNPFLLTEGLMINSEALSRDKLREIVWQVFEPEYNRRLAAAVNAADPSGADLSE